MYQSLKSRKLIIIEFYANYSIGIGVDDLQIGKQMS